MKFSRAEKKDLFYAGLMISLAFAVLLSGGYKSLLNFNSKFIFIFLIAFFTAGIGFLFHELAHKYVAQRYGFFAEFRASYGMLWLALLLSFLGFIFAAPGAVLIGSFNRHVTREKNGKIALAGPLTNTILAILFLMLNLIFYNSDNLFKSFLIYGLSINSLLAAFNMIPVMPFDGAKIKSWNLRIYALITILAIGLFILSWFI